MDNDKLYALAKKWKDIADKKLIASKTSNEVRKINLEHFAQGYFDCAEELNDNLTERADIDDLRRRLARIESVLWGFS